MGWYGSSFRRGQVMSSEVVEGIDRGIFCLVVKVVIKIKN